jgi:hypothetical protein
MGECGLDSSGSELGPVAGCYKQYILGFNFIGWLSNQEGHCSIDLHTRFPAEAEFLVET